MDNVDHHEMLVKAFARVLKAEEEERKVEVAIKEVKDVYASTLNAAKKEQVEAWGVIESLMNETGEFEVILPDDGHDFKIAFSSTPEVLDVPDAEAVPDEFCRIERSVKKKEALDHLKALRDAGQPLPNWATIKRNKGSLTYRLVKKSA